MDPLLPYDPFDEPLLVVDDNVDFAENLHEIFTARGFECHVALSLRDACKAVQKERHSVAFLDINLPDGDGVQLLGELRKLQPDLLAIMVTGYQSIENAIGALNAGAFGYVTKGGGPEELIAALERAHEKRRLEAENLKLKDLYGQVMFAIPGQLVVLDARGNILSANRVDPNIFGARGALEKNRKLADCLTPALRQNVELTRLLASATADVVSCTINTEHEGAQRVFVVRVFPLSHPDAKRAILFTDITSNLDLERRLQEAEHLATIGRLAAVVAHEIKNPLAGIRGAIQILERRMEKSSGHDREVVAEIIGLVDRMRATIHDLLAFARPTPPKLERINLLGELRSCLAVLSADPVMRGIETEIDVGENLVLPADAHQLRQVFTNLMLNAAQAMGGKGKLHLSATANDDMVELSIRDSGPGIDPGVLPQIFEPFFTTKTHGTGLGLAITQRVVKDHGGAIRAENRAEGGACFCITLPRLEQR
ncbi:MAG: response regulator [Planctomycetota bacterium]